MKATQYIELLESRIAPASLVGVVFNESTGELKIAGDANENSVSLTQTGADTYVVESTTDDLNAPGNHVVAITGHVNKLTIDGGAGTDAFAITNFTTLNRFKLKASSGNDVVQITDLETKGNAVFNFGNDGANVSIGGASTQIGGNLVLNFGAGGGSSNHFDLSASSIIIKGRMDVNGGSGNEDISVNTDSLTIGKDIDFASGSGGGSMTITAVKALIGSGFAALNMTTGRDGAQFSLQAEDATFNGSMKMAGGGTLSLSSHTFKVNGDFNASGGAGGSSISLRSVYADFNGRVNIDLKGGSDSVNLEADAVLNFGNEFKLGTLHGGELHVSGLNVAFAKSVAIDSPAGVCTFSAVEKISVGGDCTVFSSDVISFSSSVLLVSGKLLVDDTNSLGFHGEQATLAGGISFSGYSAVFSTLGFECGGNINVKGTRGVNFSIGAIACHIAGDVNITVANTMKSSDAISLDGGGTIGGDVRLDLGTTNGTRSIAFARLLIGGDLTVNSRALAGAAPESVSLSNVTVSKAVDIRLGAAQDNVTIDNLSAEGTFNLDTGAGNDIVAIERGNLAGASIFTKLAMIQLGAGDDRIAIGKSTTLNSGNDTDVFNGGLLVDGGAGTDDSNDFVSALVNTGVVAADRTGFEAETQLNT